jgi:hypothetical protein
MKRATTRLAAIVGALGFAAVAWAQSTQTIRGDVEALEGNDLHVRSAAGQQSVVKLADARIRIRVPMELDAIKAGDFIGTTASPGPNGTLVASEVHVLPESMRGAGEGHRPMANMPGSTMTNATVASVSGAASKGSTTMTNATVANVGTSAKGRTLKLTYRGGEQTVFVPDNIPVVAEEIGSRASLAPGSHVVVYAKSEPGGDMTASRISVGKNGSVPQN